MKANKRKPCEKDLTPSSRRRHRGHGRKSMNLRGYAGRNARQLAGHRKALDVPVESEQRVVRGDVCAMRWQQREADDVASAEDDFGLRVGREPHDPAPSAKRSRHVQIPRAIERQTLRATEPPVERADFAGRRDAIDALEARSSRAGDVKIA